MTRLGMSTNNTICEGDGDGDDDDDDDDDGYGALVILTATHHTCVFEGSN